MFPLKGDLYGLLICIHAILFSSGWPWVSACCIKLFWTHLQKFRAGLVVSSIWYVMLWFILFNLAVAISINFLFYLTMTKVTSVVRWWQRIKWSGPTWWEGNGIEDVVENEWDFLLATTPPSFLFWGPSSHGWVNPLVFGKGLVLILRRDTKNLLSKSKSLDYIMVNSSITELNGCKSTNNTHATNE